MTPRSLRGRLTLLLLAGCGLVLAGAGVTAVLLARSAVETQFDAALEAKARALITLTEQEGDHVEFEFADEVMPEFDAEEEPEYFELWIEPDTVLERSRSLGSGDLPRRDWRSATPWFRDLSLPDGRRGRLVQLSFVPRIDEEDGEEDEDSDQGETTYTLAEPGKPAPMTLIVARSRAELDGTLGFLTTGLLLIFFLLLGSLAVLVSLAVRVGLKPLIDIADQVQAVGAHSLDERVSVASAPLELAPILAALNELLGRLEKAFQRERQLSNDVAHELRTPIAELRNLAFVGRTLVPGDAPGDGDARAIQEFFHDIEEISVEMERMVRHLLAMARAEGSSNLVEETEVALDEIAEAAWGSWSSAAQQRGIEVSRDLEPGASLWTDRAMLLRIVGNLVHNAVRHGVPGTTVGLRTAAQEGTSSIEIANDTHDLEPGDEEAMFQRFWRKDSARTDSSHTGIGLALVRTYVQLLNLDLEATLAPGGRLTVTLAGPALRAKDFPGGSI